MRCGSALRRELLMRLHLLGEGAFLWEGARRPSTGTALSLCLPLIQFCLPAQNLSVLPAHSTAPTLYHFLPVSTPLHSSLVCTLQSLPALFLQSRRQKLLFKMMLWILQGDFAAAFATLLSLQMLASAASTPALYPTT